VKQRGNEVGNVFFHIYPKKSRGVNAPANETTAGLL